MQLSQIPSKFNVAFASSAAGGFIRTVPQTPTGTLGQASLQLGFPPENFSPVASGGVPPFGQDFNGLLNQVTAWNRWASAGGAFPPYDSTFQTAIGGYPQTALVSSLTQVPLIYMSIVDNNLTNPDAGGAGWITFFNQLTANTNLYVSTTGNDSNNGLTVGSPFLTIQHALNVAWTFPPNPSFSITINLADGTYSAGGTTPSIPGPPIIINGNSGTPSNVVISVSGGVNNLAVIGPNTMTAQNLKVINSSSSAAGFSAGQGATMNTNHTVSGAVAGWVFLATNGGTMNPGTHSFSGNMGYGFAAYTNGNTNLVASAVYTLTLAMTDTAFAIATSTGSITVPGTSAPTFVNPGNLTSGLRYNATFNGVINTQGGGANYFPGASVGTTSTGGQYGV
jgi:hypothetical protein